VLYNYTLKVVGPDVVSGEECVCAWTCRTFGMVLSWLLSGDQLLRYYTLSRVSDYALCQAHTLLTVPCDTLLLLWAELQPQDRPSKCFTRRSHQSCQTCCALCTLW